LSYCHIDVSCENRYNHLKVLYVYSYPEYDFFVCQNLQVYIQGNDRTVPVADFHGQPRENVLKRKDFKIVRKNMGNHNEQFERVKRF
jgi:hypothetical protein